MPYLMVRPWRDYLIEQTNKFHKNIGHERRIRVADYKPVLGVEKQIQGRRLGASDLRQLAGLSTCVPLVLISMIWDGRPGINILFTPLYIL